MRLIKVFASLVFDLAMYLVNAGIATAASTPIIATTIIGSMRVNPLCTRPNVLFYYPRAVTDEKQLPEPEKIHLHETTYADDDEAAPAATCRARGNNRKNSRTVRRDRFPKMTKVAYLVDGLRTPFGRHGGALAGVRADDMAGHVVKGILARNSVPADAVDEVILGCANQAGEDNRNVARMAGLLAGLPISVPGVTVNRLCGSGLQAFNDAARLIMLGEADLVVAGGVEQMTRAPLVMPKAPKGFHRGNLTAFDTTLGWRMVNPIMEKMHGTLGLGLTAEEVANEYKVTRDQQDDLAFESQQRAAKAKEKGLFDAELLPIVVGKERKTGEEIVMSVDEHPRPEVTREKLGKLKPVFSTEGTVTAGNASGINDGAAAILVASEESVKKYNLTPLARYTISAVAGVPPSMMGIGPIPATQKALKMAGLKSSQITLAEINEAFAAQAVPCIQELGFDPASVNVNGGAIAIGHPLGASGARLVLTLAHEMRRRKEVQYGLASMCIGVGQGIATIIERC